MRFGRLGVITAGFLIIAACATTSDGSQEAISVPGTTLITTTTTAVTTTTTTPVPDGFVRFDGSAHGFTILMPADWELIPPEVLEMTEGADLGEIMSDNLAALFGGGSASLALLALDPLAYNLITIDPGVRTVRQRPDAVARLNLYSLGQIEGITDLESVVMSHPLGDGVRTHYRIPAWDVEATLCEVITDNYIWMISLVTLEGAAPSSTFGTVCESFQLVPVVGV